MFLNQLRRADGLTRGLHVALIAAFLLPSRTALRITSTHKPPHGCVQNSRAESHKRPGLSNSICGSVCARPTLVQKMNDFFKPRKKKAKVAPPAEAEPAPPAETAPAPAPAPAAAPPKPKKPLAPIFAPKRQKAAPTVVVVESLFR